MLPDENTAREVFALWATDELESCFKTLLEQSLRDPASTEELGGDAVIGGIEEAFAPPVGDEQVATRIRVTITVQGLDIEVAGESISEQGVDFDTFAELHMTRAGRVLVLTRITSFLWAESSPGRFIEPVVVRLRSAE